MYRVQISEGDRELHGRLGGLQRDMLRLLQLLLLLQSLDRVSRAEPSLLHIFLLLPPAKLEAMLRGWKLWQRRWGKPLVSGRC